MLTSLLAILTTAAMLILGLQITDARNLSANFPAVVCSDVVSCDIRMSYDGRAYIFQQSTQMLYISDLNGDAYQTYDLSLYKYQLNGLIDFVPFDELGLVAFYSDDGSGHIELYNLETGQLALLDLSAQGKLVPCNYYTRLLYLVPGFIARLGDQDQLLLCSFTSQHTFQMTILDVSSQAVINTIDFGFPRPGEGPILPPWNAMAGGMDGNIYIETDSTPISDFLANMLTDSDSFESGSRLIFKFSPQTNTWSVNQVLPRQLQSRVSDDSPLFVTANQLTVVDEQGKYYFYLDWTDPDSDGTRRTEVIRLNAELDELAQINETDLVMAVVPAGITADGHVLVRGGSGLDKAVIVDMDDYTK